MPPNPNVDPHPFYPEFLKHLETGGQPVWSGSFIPGDQIFRTVYPEFCAVTAAQYGCVLSQDYLRMDDARDLWLYDYPRFMIRDSKSPDHWKRISVLVYWLRRRVPVIGFNHMAQTAVPVDIRNKFHVSANEICAFLFGFRLCCYFELLKSVAPGTSMVHHLRTITVDDAFLFDAALVLREKNVSPHALVLIYRALFINLQMPPPNRVVSLADHRK